MANDPTVEAMNAVFRAEVGLDLRLAGADHR